MATSWDSAKSAALKVLGNKAKLPEPTGIDKSMDGLDTAFEAFDQSRETIEDKVVALQNANADVKKAFEQFGKVVDKSDFGLDKKDKDDAKKIAIAQKILDGFVSAVSIAQDVNNKNLTELSKHIILLSKYKPAR